MRNFCLINLLFIFIRHQLILAWKSAEKVMKNHTSKNQVRKTIKRCFNYGWTLPTPLLKVSELYIFKRFLTKIKYIWNILLLHHALEVVSLLQNSECKLSSLKWYWFPFPFLSLQLSPNWLSRQMSFPAEGALFQRYVKKSIDNIKKKLKLQKYLGSYLEINL